jgi:hypothetical protein
MLANNDIRITALLDVLQAFAAQVNFQEFFGGRSSAYYCV